METSLFYADTSRLLGSEALRAAARSEVESSPLIRRAWTGDLDAARAMHIGFWNFVHEFEIAIDQQVLQRQPLQKKFGAQRTSEVFHALFGAVREMKKEEGQHAAHWRKDALCLGLDNLDGPEVPAVSELVNTAYTKDLPKFFSVLAGTEYIAEELSKYLLSSSEFTPLFSRKRWVWGEVHTIPHDDGPSHLEIDLDLARAYSSDGNLTSIRQMVLDTIHLFGKASREVEDMLVPAAAVA
jgi:hypothetical protein